MKEEKIILHKLLVCAYIIIALLAINTIILLATNIHVSSDNKDTTVESSGEYDVSMMNNVDMDKLLDLFDSKENQVVYLGRETCGFCVQFLPVLQQAQEEYGYTTNYLDITTVTTEDVNKLLKKDNDEKFLEENYGSTPMVLIVKNGKLVDTWVGYSEYDEFAQFLEKNGFKK